MCVLFGDCALADGVWANICVLFGDGAWVDDARANICALFGNCSWTNGVRTDVCALFGNGAWADGVWTDICVLFGNGAWANGVWTDMCVLFGDSAWVDGVWADIYVLFGNGAWVNGVWADICVICVIWRHQIKTFSALLAICAGNSPLTGDLRRHRAHYDVTLMGKWKRRREKERDHYNDARIKENIKTPRHWRLWGEFTGDCEFPAQKSSNAENVFIWWRHHAERRGKKRMERDKGKGRGKEWGKESVRTNTEKVNLEPALIDHTMMTSSNGNIFCVTGHLCGEFTADRWIPRRKASDAELWCILWSTLE